jgi:hypothetical protein
MISQESELSAPHIVVDICVVVAAVSPKETRHAESLDFLQEAHRRRVVLEEPAQFLLELYAVLTRTPRQLRQLGFMTEEEPISLNLKPLGTEEVQRLLAWLSSTFPGKCPTRGGDLAYVWAAWETKLPLVTLDCGLHQFRSPGLDIYYPCDLLAVWRTAAESTG